jgi:hypothetical protein
VSRWQTQSANGPVRRLHRSQFFLTGSNEELAPRNRRARCFSDVLISFPPPLRQLYGARRALSPTVDPTLGLVGGAAFLATEEHAPISMVGLHERLPGQTYPLM